MAERRPASVMRREPVQERSRQRVESMLDAAGRVLLEVGWDGFTTDAVAAAAGVPIGSVYQYFPNKHSLLEQLAARSLHFVDDLLDVTETASFAALPWRQRLETLIQGLAAGSRDRVSRAVWELLDSLPAMRGRLDGYRAAQARVVERIVADVRPDLARSRRALMARLVVESLWGGFDLWVREGARGRAHVEELTRLVTGYLLLDAGADGP